MIYTKTVTAAAGGSASIPIDTDLPVTDGLIYQFELYFPPGSSGLLHVRMADGAYPIWPSEPGEYFFGDNALITFPDRYFIQAPDHKLKVWYYNLDDTYAHKFQLRIGQVSAEIFIASFLPSVAFESLADAINKLTQGQEEEKAARVELIEEYFAEVEA